MAGSYYTADSSMCRSRDWMLGSLVIVFVLCESRMSRAQIRPAVADRACTRITLVPVPGTGLRARSIGLRIVNQDPGDFPAVLQPDVEIQQQVRGRWRTVSRTVFQLRTRCTQASSQCITVAPRREYRVFPWTGNLGDGQCPCEQCPAAPAGTYRFVVTTCEHCQSPVSTASPPFTLPALSSVHP
jgi:hypothetical protein